MSATLVTFVCRRGSAWRTSGCTTCETDDSSAWLCPSGITTFNEMLGDASGTEADIVELDFGEGKKFGMIHGCSRPAESRCVKIAHELKMCFLDKCGGVTQLYYGDALRSLDQTINTNRGCFLPTNASSCCRAHYSRAHI